VDEYCKPVVESLSGRPRVYICTWFATDVTGTFTPSLPVSLKRIRPGWVMFSQETAVKFFCDESIIRELESDFVVELPFVPSLRVEGQRNAAVRDCSFRWAALDL
jgi:hypothetical protein